MNETNEETLPYANALKNNPAFREIREKMIAGGFISGEPQDAPQTKNTSHDKRIKQAKAQEQSELMSMYTSGELKEPEYTEKDADVRPSLSRGADATPPTDRKDVHTPPTGIQTSGTSGTNGTDCVCSSPASAGLHLKGYANPPTDRKSVHNPPTGIQTSGTSGTNGTADIRPSLSRGATRPLLRVESMHNPPTGIQTSGTSGTNGTTDVRPSLSRGADATPPTDRKSAQSFWYTTERGRLDVSASDFIDWLASKGFRRLAGGSEDDLQLVHVSEHVIRPFSTDMLINRLDEIFRGTHDSSEHVDKEYTYREIYSRIIEKISTLFEHKLLLTLPTEERNAPVPTRTEEYYPYRNGIVKVTKSEISLIPYSTMPYRFFESEIIPRDFDLATESDTMTAEFAKFASLTCSVHPDGKVWKNDYEMWHAKLAAIGYLLAHYMDPVCTRAVIFCDSGNSDSAEANGRSGKGLIANAISKIIPMVTINGKVFNPNRDKFAYSQIKRGTRLVCLDDVARNFSLEPLFSILTEGVQVERKGQNSFRIPYSESPKFLLTMNSLFAGTGGSEHARKYEVPFGGFFSAEYTPYEHFGHSFFDEWSTAEWRLFDNFMMWCVKYYLDKGLPTVSSDELEKKRIAQVCNYSGDLEDYLRGIAGAVKNGGFIATADLIRDAREAAKDLDPEDLRKLNTKIIVKIFHLICRDMGVKVKSVRRRNELGNSLRGYAV